MITFPSNMSNPSSNDPWNPVRNEKDTVPKLPQAPADPLRTIISSESYIASLEKKLHKIKGKQTDNLKAREMIGTLQTAKESHLAEILSGNQNPAISDDEFTECDNTSITSSLQRRMNPEKQALSQQELLPLVSNDVLAKVTELENDTKELT